MIHVHKKLVWAHLLTLTSLAGPSIDQRLFLICSHLHPLTRRGQRSCTETEMKLEDEKDGFKGCMKVGWKQGFLVSIDWP